MATFFANEDYVAATLCINKDNPEMHCNGLCQLDKKLQEDQDQSQTSSDKKVNIEASVFFFPKIEPMRAPISTLASTPKNGHPQIFCKQDYQAPTFHPPSLLAI